MNLPDAWKWMRAGVRVWVDSGNGRLTATLLGEPEWRGVRWMVPLRWDMGPTEGEADARDLEPYSELLVNVLREPGEPMLDPAELEANGINVIVKPSVAELAAPHLARIGVEHRAPEAPIIDLAKARAERAGCVLAFDRDDPEFVHGVQVGMVWAQLDPAFNPPAECDALLSACNAEMARRIGEGRGYNVTIETFDETDEWIVATFTRKPR